MDRKDVISAAFGSVIVGALVWFILLDRDSAEQQALRPAESAPEAASTPTLETASEPKADEETASAAPEEPSDEATVSDAAQGDGPTEPVEEKVEEPAAGQLAVTDTAEAEEEVAVSEAVEEPAERQEPTSESHAATAPETGTETEKEAEPPLREPVFDVVRIEPDGSGLVAGRAAPGATVEVIVEGEIVAEVVAGPDGAFVAFIQVEPNAEAETTASEADQPATTDAASPNETAVASVEETPETEDEPSQAALTEAVEPEEATTSSSGDGAVGAPPASAPETAAKAAAEATPETENERAAEMQAAAGMNAAARSIILRAKPGETLPVVESAPVFVVGGAGPETAPLIVQPEESGLRLVQPPSRPASKDVTLDTISYDADGRVVFAGRARPKSAVRLYLNAAPIAEAPVADDGSWRTRAAETIASGVYTLRLDQVDAAGKVLSRIETPFLREAITEGPVGDNTITVQSGDNLWRISESFYGEGVRYTVIYGANKGQIRDPDLIYPGQIFTVPDEPRSE